jgi:hypothetical protein
VKCARHHHADVVQAGLAMSWCVCAGWLAGWLDKAQRSAERRGGEGGRAGGRQTGALATPKMGFGECTQALHAERICSGKAADGCCACGRCSVEVGGGVDEVWMRCG